MTSVFWSHLMGWVCRFYHECTRWLILIM